MERQENGLKDYQMAQLMIGTDYKDNSSKDGVKREIMVIH